MVLKYFTPEVLEIRNNTAFLLLKPNGSTIVEVQPIHEIHYCSNRHI